MKKPKFNNVEKSTKIAICCGLICAISISCYLVLVKKESSEALAKYGGERVEVCVAKKDIPAGETVSESDVETRTWVASLLPEEAVVKRDECVGKMLGSSIVKGEPITAKRFQANVKGVKVPDGMVALSIPTDSTASLGGNLQPTQRVDIYATGPSSTTRIVKNVEILETSNSEKIANASNGWIVVAVEASHVQELVAAIQELQLYITLPSSATYDDEEEINHE